MYHIVAIVHGIYEPTNITRGARIGPGKLIIDGDPQRSAHLMPGENGWNPQQKDK
jgi:hypothetical protein